MAEGNRAKELRRVASQLAGAALVHADATNKTAGAGMRDVFDALLFEMSQRTLDSPLPPVLRLAATDGGELRGSAVATELMARVEGRLGRLPTTDEVGVLYDTLGGIADGDNPRVLRRSSGRYLTPPSLARLVARLTLSQTGGLVVPVIDPAAGAGSMLIHVLRESQSGSPRQAAQLLHGVDLDPIAVGLARALIWLECGDPTWDGQELVGQMRVGDAVLSTLADWRTWFPDIFTKDEQLRFGAVVTNPPWNRTRPMKSAFAAEWVGSEEALGEAWLVHRRDQRAYADALRSHPEYKWQGRGDGDLYKYFLERIHALLTPSGVAGLLLPSGFLKSAGAAELRRLYLNSGEFALLSEFINKKRIFPIHGMFRFVLGVYHKGAGGGVKHYQVNMLDPDEAAKGTREVALTPQFLKTVSGRNTGFPEVRSNQDLELLERLYREHPVLGEVGGEWSIKFDRELDMSLDKDRFVHVSDAEATGMGPGKDGRWEGGNREALLPVYEGRMVHQFDAAAKSYVKGRGRSALWEGTAGLPRPQYLVPESLGREVVGPPMLRAGFCDVSGHANERTVLAALIPVNSVCGNKVPTARFEPRNLRLDLLWLSVVNSFTFDWIARRWVSTTLNFFYWWNFPFPRIDPTDPANGPLVEGAAALSGVTLAGNPRKQPVKDPWVRAAYRADIEARVARMFTLTLEEYEHVLEDFPLVDRDQPTADGSRSRITRDVAMLAMVEATGGQDLSLRRRVESSRAVGAVPFKPTGS